ncbi:MAG: YncE family protein [Bacteroidota bacterium]|nr:YncE family protein [Bacteroidota bacterium]
MRNKIRFTFILNILFLCFSFSGYSQSTSFKVVKTFSIPSPGGWDYIAFNDNKVYVSHGTQVNILNAGSGDSVGIIPGTTGVHGIAFYNELHKGYTSNGRLNNVFAFDLSTNKVLKTIATGENPDAIFYEDFSKKIITCNGRSKSLSVIDPVTDAVVATIELGGKPEEAVSDGKGKLFVNLEDKNQIAEVDMKNFSVINHWSITPGESASGLKIDRKTNRLFAGCENKMMVVVNAENGKVITNLPIGEGCDGLVFSPKEKLIFTSNGEGTITVIKERNENKYEVVQTIPTKKSARTITIDEHTNTLYLPCADIEPAAPGAVANERRKMVPGSFKVLAVKE